MVFQVTVYTEDDGSTTLSMDVWTLLSMRLRKKSPQNAVPGRGKYAEDTAKRLPCIRSA